MPAASNWLEIVKPSYTVLLPELILLGTMLLVMVADLYMKEKKLLTGFAFAGVMLALGAVFFTATDAEIAGAISKGNPLEFWGGMITADTFSFFMKGVLLFITGMLILLSVGYVDKFLHGMFMEFYEVVFAATLGMMFMVSSRDLITIYVGLELSSISSYVLAGLLRHDPKSNEAGLKYFLNGAFASAVLLFGVSLLYGAAGTTYLPTIAASVTTNAGFLPLLAVGTLFVVVGFGFKVAAAPMHLWAPDVYEGSPTPVTAFFSVGPKGAAFAAILRIFLIALGVSELSGRWMLMFAVLSAASMFLGNLTALMQSNVKRMMAYSSIAQAGYVLVGVVSAGNLPGGTSAVLYYVLAYAITNLGIFAVLTHMDQEGGWVTVEDFKGLAQREPVYAWALLLFFVSLIGIPPTVGFLGKFFLFRAAVGSGYLWLALAMAVNSVISVGYYYGVVKAMFLEKSDKGALETSYTVKATVVISMVAVVVVALWASPFVGWTQTAAALLK